MSKEEDVGRKIREWREIEEYVNLKDSERIFRKIWL